MKLNKYWQIWALLLAFVLPMLATSIVYQNREKLNFSTTQNGTMIYPPVDVKDNKQIITGKWSIAYNIEHQCNGYCQELQVGLKKIHAALGRDRERVQYLEFNNETRLNNASISIIDPFGKAIMYYPENVDVKHILLDLRKLLKYSYVG